MSGQKGLDAKRPMEDLNEDELHALFGSPKAKGGAGAGGAGIASVYRPASVVLGGPSTNRKTRNIRKEINALEKNEARLKAQSGPAFANMPAGQARAAANEQAAANFRAKTAQAKENRVAAARAAATAKREAEEAAQKARTNAYTHAIQYGTTKKVAEEAGKKAYNFAKKRKTRKSRKAQTTRKNNRR